LLKEDITYFLLEHFNMKPTEIKKEGNSFASLSFVYDVPNLRTAIAK